MEEQITQLLKAEYPEASIQVAVDGNRATITIAHVSFADMSRVKQQQAVYACIDELIKSGELHAVTIKAAGA